MQAHLAPVTSAEDVERCMTTLLQHNKIRNATHNILAYRIYVEDRDAWLQVTPLCNQALHHVCIDLSMNWHKAMRFQ